MSTGPGDSALLTSKQNEQKRKDHAVKIEKLQMEEAARLAEVAKKLLQLLADEGVTVKESDTIWRTVQAGMSAKIDRYDLKTIMGL